jgi:hypothetical protein
MLLLTQLHGRANVQQASPWTTSPQCYQSLLNINPAYPTLKGADDKPQ